MRIRLSEWGERNFSAKSRPCADTLRKMAEDGDIDGATRIRGRWYVDIATPADPAFHRSMIHDTNRDRREADLIRANESYFCKNWMKLVPKPSEALGKSIDWVEFLHGDRCDTGSAVYFLIDDNGKINYVGLATVSVASRVVNHIDSGKKFSRVYFESFDSDNYAKWIESICISWLTPAYNKVKGASMPHGFQNSEIENLPDVSSYVQRKLPDIEVSLPSGLLDREVE